jgi:hypothetical protein
MTLLAHVMDRLMIEDVVDSQATRAFRINDPEISEDDVEWAERSAYWQQQALWRPRHPHQKRKHRNPLILGGHGVRLRIDRGSLFVQNGFTHYPQRREEWRFFPGHPDLPSRIVVVDADGSITFDVLAWLSTQGIPLVQINWRGESIVVAGGLGYVADPKLAQAQRAAQASKRRSMEISRSLIAEKVERSIETLTECIDPSPARERRLAELAASAREMKTRPPRTINALRGIEGRVSLAYFTAWRLMPIHGGRDSAASQSPGNGIGSAREIRLIASAIEALRIRSMRCCPMGMLFWKARFR